MIWEQQISEIWSCFGQLTCDHSPSFIGYCRLEYPTSQIKSTLVCRSYFYFQNAYRYPKLYDPDNPQIDRVGLQGDAMTIEVCKDNPMIDEDIQLFSQALSQDGEIIGERLTVLSRLLKEAGY